MFVLFFYNIGFLFGIIIAWVTFPLTPIIMDYFAPLEEARPSMSLYQTDYKVDPDKYFYVIYIHGMIVSILCITMFAAVDSMYMSVTQHGCAIFEILRFQLRAFDMLLLERPFLTGLIKCTPPRFRLLNVIQDDEKTEVNLNPDLREDFAYQEIISCVKEHKRAIR